MISGYSIITGKSLYVQRLYEKLEDSVEQGTAFKNCIRLAEYEVNDSKVLQSLYDSPKQKELKMFHFDVTSSVSNLYATVIMEVLFLNNVVCRESLRQSKFAKICK